MAKQIKITISDSRKISAIQEDFNGIFPFLKLEFFAKPHTKFGASSKKLMKSNTKLLGECRTVHKKGHVNITANMTVAELESHFQDTYGLSVQVFRKSGKSWLETTATDGWTLEKQNEQGEELSKVKTEPREEIDYD